LQRLPWTAREAKELKALFEPLTTIVFTGARATRENLRSSEARNARILHIASHGYFNAASPENVGLALSVVDQGENLDPGFMSLAELFSYRYNNELVVVSGCESALGQQSGGEGLMSLTRGFMAQGASHVISTLWPVSDRASAEFIGRFYARLLKIGSVSEALRQAQEDMRSMPQYADPFFWAPYIVSTVDPSDYIQFPQQASSAPRTH
jgi:CHAT domain-containing protein